MLSLKLYLEYHFIVYNDTATKIINIIEMASLNIKLNIIQKDHLAKKKHCLRFDSQHSIFWQPTTKQALEYA